MNDADTQVLAALIQSNQALTARLEMMKRMVAFLMAEAAQQHPDPNRFVFENAERMRAALHASDGPDRTDVWDEMELSLDQMTELAKFFVSVSGR